MAGEKLTPEEKLLKIIEDPNFSVKRHSGAAGKKMSGLSEMIAPFFFGKNKYKITLQSANKVLSVVCVLVAVFVILNIQASKDFFSRRLKSIETGKIGQADEAKEPADLKVDNAEAAEMSNKRNIFKITKPEDKQADESRKKEDIAQKISKLALVGILWSEAKPQVMIENKEDEKTSLLSAGDTIGIIQVKEIRKDRVVLTVEGNDVELR